MAASTQAANPPTPPIAASSSAVVPGRGQAMSRSSGPVVAVYNLNIHSPAWGQNKQSSKFLDLEADLKTMMNATPPPDVLVWLELGPSTADSPVADVKRLIVTHMAGLVHAPRPSQHDGVLSPSACGREPRS